MRTITEYLQSGHIDQSDEFENKLNEIFKNNKKIIELFKQLLNTAYDKWWHSLSVEDIDYTNEFDAADNSTFYDDLACLTDENNSLHDAFYDVCDVIPNSQVNAKPDINVLAWLYLQQRIK